MLPIDNTWFTNSPLALYEGDLRTGLVIDGNDSLANALGVTREQLRGRPIEQLFSEQSRETIRGRLDALRRGEKLTPTFVHLIRGSGGDITVRLHDSLVPDQAGHPSRTQALLQIPCDALLRANIPHPGGYLSTHPRQRSLMQQLRSAIEQAGEAIVLTDANARIEYVNPAFERTTGYTLEEVRGENPRMLQSGQHDAAFYEQMWSTLLAGETWHGHFVNKKKSGELYDEEVSITPIFDDDGTLVNYVGVKRDVTKELQLETALQQSQRVNAMGRLAGGLAHEFNNVLQIIAGNLTFVLNAVSYNSQAHKDLIVIHEATQRAAKLTDQLLAFGRKSPIQREPLDMNHVSAHLLKMVENSLPAGVTLLFEPTSNPWPALADPKQVEQVLLNLLFNAADAIDDKGTVSIVVRNVHVPTDQNDTPAQTNQIPQNIALAQPLSRVERNIPGGRYVTTTIQDSGHGMDARVMEHMFEPFFTTKPVGKGTGLGLAVTHGIVSQHGGYIRVHSTPAQGTRFTVFWPATRPAFETPMYDLAASNAARTILVVEPNDAVRRITAMTMRRHANYDGFDILSVGTGKEATSIIRERRIALYAVITEVEPPDVPGPDLLALASEVSPTCALVAYVASLPNRTSTDKMQELGVTIVQKPSSPSQLIAHVERARKQAKAKAKSR